MNMQRRRRKQIRPRTTTLLLCLATFRSSSSSCFAWQTSSYRVLHGRIISIQHADKQLAAAGSSLFFRRKTPSLPRSTTLFRKLATSNDENNDDSGDDDILNGIKSTAGTALVTEEKLNERDEEATINRLARENKVLRSMVQRLEADLNQQSQYLSMSNKIVLESFEGEGRSGLSVQPPPDDSPVTLSGEAMVRATDAVISNDSSSNNSNELWCDTLDNDSSCPVEPAIGFGQALRDRANWLVGLLILQSASGLILARNEALLAEHPVIIYFLTMLVGAGGNAGNQASVRVIRGLALGTLNSRTQGQFLQREVKMAFALSAILATAGFVRAIAFGTPLPETVAVTTALALIVLSSVCLGAVLPLGLAKLGVDPAHSSTTIQVIMDILGVFLAVAVSSALLDSPVGKLLLNWLA